MSTKDPKLEQTSVSSISFSFLEEGDVRFCEECDGLGEIKWKSPIQNNLLSATQFEKYRCRNCGGTGRINYS